MKPFDPIAIKAHCIRAQQEGGERVVKSWNHFPGYLVEVVWFAGEDCLRITPLEAKYNECNVAVAIEEDDILYIPGVAKDQRCQVCIPRYRMADYLKPDGSVEYAALRDAAFWLVLMGKEVTEKATIAVANILVETWSDFYATAPDTLEIPSMGLAEAAIVDQDGKVISEAAL